MKIIKGDFASFFYQKVGEPLQRSVLLSLYSNFRIGGKADYFYEPRSVSQLVKAIRAAQEYDLPYYVIGGGYNLLFDDEGYRGLIIKNSVQSPGPLKKGTEIEVFAGAWLNDLVLYCQQHGLAGFEFLAGIPGTVGGAVFGNAGAFGQNIGEYLKEAILLDEKGEKRKVSAQYFAFDYRFSILKKKHFLLLKAVFSLKKGKPVEIKKRIDETLAVRESKHPPSNIACAGSYFKNPVFPEGKKVAAAYLLDQVGAKKLRVGDAAVHPSHSNFIINLGQASCQDILSLAEELKKRVRAEFGLELEEEVIHLPAEQSML